MTRSNPSSTHAGFTLVEMLVALTLFSFVLLAAVGSLVSIIDANRKARSQKVVMNNLNAALDTMTRTIREGSDHSISAGNSRMTFTTQEGRTVTYFLDNATGQINRSVDNGAPVALTAESLRVTDLTFDPIVYGALHEQFKVLISIEGSTEEGRARTRSNLALQTLVSARYEPKAPVEEEEPGHGPNVVCGFDAQPGREIVNLSTTRNELLCWFSKGNCRKSRTYVLSPEERVPPPGPGETYDLGIAGWDDHCTPSGRCTRHDNPSERFYVELYDAAGNLMFRSASASDIPQEVEYNSPPEIVNEDITFPNPVARIVAVQGPGIGSLVAACVVFDSEGGFDADIEIEPF